MVLVQDSNVIIYSNKIKVKLKYTNDNRLINKHIVNELISNLFQYLSYLSAEAFAFLVATILYFSLMLIVLLVALVDFLSALILYFLSTLTVLLASKFGFQSAFLFLFYFIRSISNHEVLLNYLIRLKLFKSLLLQKVS